LERAVLEKMGGGCHVAMGVHCRGKELLVYHEKHGMRSIDLNGLSMKESIDATLDALLGS
jgi:porphobilinogen deaminase